MCLDACLPLLSKRFLVIKSDTAEQNVNTIMEMRDASFFKEIFPMRAICSTSQSENNHTPPCESNDKFYTPYEEYNDLVNEPPRMRKRPKITESFGDDFNVYHVGELVTPQII
jgi:hypothetical protein